MRSTRDSSADREGDLGSDLGSDLVAVMQTRKELGERHEAELVRSFLERVEERLESAIDKRVRRQVAEQQMVIARGGRQPQGGETGPGPAFGVAALSLVLAIPLSAIAAVQTGLAGLLICWVGIVGVNACYSWGRMRRGLDGSEREGAWD